MNYQELRKTGILEGRTVLLIPQNKKTYDFGQGIWDYMIKTKEGFPISNPDEENRYKFLSELPMDSLHSGMDYTTDPAYDQDYDANGDYDPEYDSDENHDSQFYELSANDLVVIVKLDPAEFKDFEIDKSMYDEDGNYKDEDEEDGEQDND